MKPINKKQIVVAAIFSITIITTTSLAFVNFANNKKGSEQSLNWMKDIKDETLLSDISIPGTHDSGALYSLLDLAGKCQDVSIANQLSFGARFLDIRLKEENNNLKVIHGIVDERQNFDNVLKDTKGFLDAHPSETIIMSIKEEEKSKDGNFKDCLENKIKDDEYFYTEPSIPSIKDVRGKIVLLSRYSNSSLGIPLNSGWRDNTTFDITTDTYSFHIQDHYKLDELDEKWNDVEDCLKYTNTLDGSKQYNINFLSGYLSSGFPPSYSVPVAKYMNPKTKEEIIKYNKTGTILFDFINEDLAKAVYERNFK